jgi:hypothetical protein
MSALINALDSFTDTRIGENNHAELDWSNDIQERIAQFDFQCVRTSGHGISNLSEILDSILQQLTTSKSPSKKELLVSLFKIIAKTRDINGGKGEYALSYMMIWTWYKYFPNLAVIALKMFVLKPNQIDESLLSQEPYGSWKDIKYFCKYVLDNGDTTMEHPLILSCIHLINETLKKDADIFSNGGKTITLVGKWIPRENSKFGFLFEALATDYFKHFMITAKTEESKKKAVALCKTHYRILCANLNRLLDTVQIKQTANCWANINHAKTTSMTIAKQRKAFLNKTKDNKTRSQDPDRIACAENFRAYLLALKKEVKGKHVGFEMFGAQALDMLYNNVINQEEVNILNSQWRDNGNKKNADCLGLMVPIVDTSGSMWGDPLCAALSLGCRVAEKSILGTRVMTFSAEPEWINLDGSDTFTDMVGAIMKQSNKAGFNTNFYKAMDMILTEIQYNHVPPRVVENMILAVFSDMQIDDNLHVMTSGLDAYHYTDEQKLEARGKWATMHEQIKKRYADAGMKIYGVPLKPPHILFWNLRKTEGFPTLSTEAGCSMMSGYDPAVLNIFCEIGINALKEMTPFKTLTNLLDNPRYMPFDKIIRQELQFL